jgi:proteasome accessory factor B
VEHLLYQNPNGLMPGEIARFCEVSVRTSYRDLKALQGTLKLPVWQEGQRYGISRGHYLPPVQLSLLEAVALFLSARLVCRYSDERDPHIESAFIKLASVLPPPIAGHLQQTTVAMMSKPENLRFVQVFETLAVGWAQKRRVRICYRRYTAQGIAAKSSQRLIDPYFIEPSGITHACYVIGLDSQSKQIRTFKIERVEEAELTEEEFSLPEGWKAGEYLRSSWGISIGDEVEVSVRFSPRAADRVKESVWHPSQSLTDQPDGSLLFQARVSGILELVPWLLSWGAEAEVLAPSELREQFTSVVQRMASQYLAPEVIPPQS